jgi:tetratricopeptide (TPR) repeat protein/energy-coupling factor transporter ATP-binding protein EcfA2
VASFLRKLLRRWPPERAATPAVADVPARPLVGRERELEELVAILAAAGPGRGRLVLLAGHTGFGKSDLLAAVCGRLRASGEAEASEVVLVPCFASGASVPLSAFADVLAALVREDGRRVKAKRAVEIVREVAPLLEFVPVAGAPLSAGAKVATSLTLRSLGGDARAEQAQRSADVVSALTTIAAREAALVVAIDDAQWLDEQSVDVVLRLLRAFPAAPVTLVLAYGDDVLDAGAPLRLVLTEAVVADDVATRVDLEPFTVEEVRRLVERAFGSEVDERLAPWLTEAAEGNPLFAETYVRTLAEQGVVRRENGRAVLQGSIAGGPGEWALRGPIADLPPPSRIVELLRTRAEKLEDAERLVLESGAVQGKRFLTVVLARLLGSDERSVLDSLHRIHERRRLVVFDAKDEWWTRCSDVVAFAPGVMREVFYERYRRTHRERLARHAEVARALDELVAGMPGEPPARVLLEIADHFAAAGEHVEAARRLTAIADASYAEGAVAAAEQHADRALDLLRRAGGRVDDALLARTIALLLLATERHWTVEQRIAGASLAHLADEADAAAGRTGDPDLRAEVLYVKALVYLAFHPLEEGLELLYAARALAREAGDPLAEAGILVELGHYSDQRDLRAGRALLQEAFDVVTGGALGRQLPPARVELIEAHVESAIGVAEFDLGNYGVALGHLRSAPDRLRKARSLELAAYSYSFLAQVCTAVGLFDEAEAAIRTGLALFEGEDRPTGVRGYLKGLRAHLDLEREPRRLEEALGTIREGRTESAAAGHIGVQPLVEVYYAEVLLALGDEASLVEADAVLSEAIERSERGGWPRGAIGGRALQARVALRRGKAERAVELARSAAEALEAAGGEIPVYRSEEILYTCARILHETGAGDPSPWLVRARAKVEEKAASLADPAERESFLTRVRLSRAVTAG